MAGGQFESFTSILAQINRCIQRIRDKQLQPFGLRGAHVSCLICLSQGSMTAATLAEKSCMDKAAVSRTMAELEQAGYAICDAAKGKRKYRAMLQLTETGKVMAAKLNRYTHAFFQEAYRGLPPEDRIIMEQSLQRLAGNLQRLTSKNYEEFQMTERVKLMTDSACDIPAADEERYGIEILSFSVSLGNKSYTSRKDFSFSEFYDMMESYSGIPTTAQLTPFQLGEAFERAWQEGYTDLIYTSINSQGSASYSNAEIAAQTFYADHPEAKDSFRIRLVDSGSYTMCYGYGIIEAARRLEAGCSADEAEAFLRQWCGNVVATFTPYTLKYAGKSGRIPSAAAFVGDALGIKPMMRVYDHTIPTVGRVRGEKQVIPALAQRVTTEIQPDSPYLIIYGNDPQLRDSMRETLEAQLGRAPDGYCQIGPEIAINAGPRLVGAIYLIRPECL